MSNLVEFGYNITFDPNFLTEQNHMTPELLAQLETFHNLALEGEKSNVSKLLNAIKKYPDNPQLKNFLSVLYGQLGDVEKMYETNRWIIAEHPDYLFGKLNLANEYYANDEYEKMPEVLGKAMEIKALYPNRDTFHIVEVLAFLKCAILYFTAIGDIEQAEIRYEIMCELDPEANDTKIALQELQNARMIAIYERREKEKSENISVKTKVQETKVKRQAPEFNHEEINELYANGLDIGEKTLNALLSLPRESLIQDLEQVLQDSIDRYGYFRSIEDERLWDEECLFVIHAIFLLGELKATNSLNAVFNVLSQSKEYLDFYFQEFLTESIWEPIYKLANNEFEACKAFMFRPGNDTYARSVIPDVITQVALNQPNRREEVLQWNREVIQGFLNSKLEDNVIDSEVIAFLVCDLIDIKGIDLLDEVEALFEKKIIAKGISGDWQSVKNAFNRPDNFDYKKEILPIAERYEEIASSWFMSHEHDSDLSLEYDNYFTTPAEPIRAEPKIGRNDPCPCGSGKKYKKCCMNK